MKPNGDNRRESSWGGFQYRWNYDEYQKSLQRKRKKNAAHGMRAFCLTTVFVLLLCFASLMVVMTAALVRGAANAVGDKTTQTQPNGDWSLPQETGADTGTCSDTDGRQNTALTAADDVFLGDIAETAVTDTAGNLSFIESPTGEDAAENVLAPSVLSTMTVNEIAAACTKSTVTVHCKNSEIEAVGSGFFLSSDGYFVTNYHVIRKFSAYEAVLSDGTAYAAELIGSAPERDIALLKIDVTDAPAVTVGSSDALVIGDEVVAIGTPGSMEFAGTVTWGNVSGLNREVPVTDEEENILGYMNMIQISAVINPGNSGGPLFNVRGEVIGINTMKFTGDGFEGMGFSIPMDVVIETLTGWIEAHRAEHAPETDSDMLGTDTDAGETVVPDTIPPEPEPKIPASLGIRCEAVTEEEAALYRVPRGVLIRFVEPDSDAEVCGLKSGDIILSSDGVTLDSLEAFDAFASGLYAGDTHVLRVFRGGEEREINVIMTAPADTQAIVETETEAETAALVPAYEAKMAA